MYVVKTCTDTCMDANIGKQTWYTNTNNDDDTEIN